MDFIESLLAQASSGPQVHPEVLETLGRQASQLFQQKGISLNDAIQQVAAAHPELTPEHLKRVVEFANTVTFQEMFQNSADKNVHFEVADPGVVLRDLKDGGTPSHDGKPLNTDDYNKPPKTQEAGFPEAEQLFSQQFTSGGNGGTVDMPKVASARLDNHEMHANPLEDLFDTKLRLEASREKIAAANETMDLMLKQAKEDFYRAVKNEVLDPDGAGLGGVIGVMQKVASFNHCAPALQNATMRLLEEGVHPEVLDESLHKQAGSVVNYNHPIVRTWSAMHKLAQELVTSNQALADVDSMLEKTAGALASGIKETVGVRGKVPSGLRQRFPRK